jgi:hypothetical protein
VQHCEGSHGVRCSPLVYPPSHAVRADAQLGSTIRDRTVRARVDPPLVYPPSHAARVDAQPEGTVCDETIRARDPPCIAAIAGDSMRAECLPASATRVGSQIEAVCS